MHRSRSISAWLLTAALLAALAGCSPKEGATNASTGGKPVETAGASTDKPAGKATLADIPADVKHEAYEYYGLENTAPIELEMRQGAATLTGSRLNRLVEIKDGNAVFEVEHTGSLQGIGTFRYSVEKDGIYSLETTKAKLTPPRNLELPADLAPGKTWANPNLKMVIETEMGPQTIESDHTYKVVRTEKVKTKAGEYDALLIQAGGPGKENGVATQHDMKVWLVKGLGAVKMQVVQTKNGQKTTSVIEATKVVKQ